MNNSHVIMDDGGAAARGAKYNSVSWARLDAEYPG